MSELRTAPVNLLSVISGELLLRVANFAVAVLIGRIYGPAALGVFAAIIAVVTVAERLADNGLEMAGIAEASMDSSSIAHVASALYANKSVLSVLALVVLAGIGWLAKLPRIEWTVAGILTLRAFLYSYSRLHAGLLKALNKMNLIARCQAVHFLVLVTGVLVASTRKWGLVSLLLSLLVAQFIEYILSLRYLRKSGIRARPVPLQYCWKQLTRSTPVGVVYSISNLALRGDVLVLSILVPAGVLGTFAAANMGLVLMYVVAWLFGGVLLSDMARLSTNSPALAGFFSKCVRRILLTTIPAALVAALIAPWAVRAVFGKNLAAAALPATVMASAIPFLFLNAAYLSRAIACNALQVFLTIVGIATAFSLALNFILGSWYGPTGVACSIVIREAGMALAFFLHARMNAPPMQTESPLGAGAEITGLMDT
jgi:O-antigen/teichoic acid export membrane protein